MSLYRSAQVMNLDDFGGEDEVVLYDEKPSKEDVIEMHQPEEMVVFKLPPLPGSDVEELEVSTDDNLEAKEPEQEKPADLEVSDPWDWKSGGLRNGLNWVAKMFASIPRHSGKETTGIERAIAYLKRLDAELSKMASSDYNEEIDISKFEEARKEIHDAIDRLEDAKERLQEARNKRKKSGASNPDMVKEAKQTHIDGMIITVPVFISTIARACINSTVSAGKDINKTAEYFIKKFNLNDREQMELITVLQDMGMAIRAPRGMLFDETFDATSVDNVDFIANYPA